MIPIMTWLTFGVALTILAFVPLYFIYSVYKVYDFHKLVQSNTRIVSKTERSKYIYFRTKKLGHQASRFPTRQNTIKKGLKIENPSRYKKVKLADFTAQRSVVGKLKPLQPSEKSSSNFCCWKKQ